MRRSLLTYLEDINLAISDIEDFTTNKSLDDYRLNKMLQAAVERKFIVIGEAFAQMEQHFPGNRQRIDDVRSILAFRNLLVHQYDAVDVNEVFNIARGPMLLMKAQVKTWIAELDPDNRL